MRCLVGFTLFVVLYFGSCKLLGEAAGAIATAKDPHHSQRAGRAVAAQVVTKYHALVAVGVGVVVLLGCSLPTILARRSERAEWQSYGHAAERR